MNCAAYEILSIVDECEAIDHPEMIPSPQKVRLDPQFGDALDSLLENGYVEVCKARHSTHHDENLAIDLGIFDPNSESLTITPRGTSLWHTPSSEARMCVLFGIPRKHTHRSALCVPQTDSRFLRGAG